MADTRNLAFSLSDLNPLHWLGSAASAAVGDVWKAIRRPVQRGATGESLP